NQRTISRLDTHRRRAEYSPQAGWSSRDRLGPRPREEACDSPEQAAEFTRIGQGQGGAPPALGSPRSLKCIVRKDYIRIVISTYGNPAASSSGPPASCSKTFGLMRGGLPAKRLEYVVR